MKLYLSLLLIILFAGLLSAQNSAYISDVYSKQVPHIDKNGNVLIKYDENKSFFPIAMWGASNSTEVYGKTYDWNILKEAGYNTVWPWPSENRVAQLDKGAEYGMQIVLMNPINDESFPLINNHPNLLGNCWKDEPIGQLGPKMQGMFDDFTEYKNKAKKLAPNLKVFINDAPWITEPATEWWIKWNKAGDISCHDSYPVYNKDGEAARSLGTGHDMPASMNLAVSSTDEKMPVWIIIGAFTQQNPYGSSYPFRFPTPNQLRSCVYTAIEHGATGITYFIWDSYISREGQCIGMSPDPQTDMGNGDPKYVIAKPIDLINAKANWEMAAQINRELKELAPIILTPTDTKTQFTVKITGKGVTEQPIHCMLKKDPEGGWILFTTNIDASFLKVEYTFMTSITEAKALYENQKPLTVENDTFSLSYEPFETHIIKIK